ncbi:GNAT family N-acetyltransferase [Pseudoalteromonas sp. MMG012]|uniref:GNAT family N-acetyltransferase n=1 Tax=Pseudoalteromonas sp. MMG012 TaxID=2822686 RepID=UPI001B39E55B|nr:GNAT family N-acetyltransferase [Pseudoalteromonas sp. MMG012]MBQ4850841.1 GNAT family N-acetyltransferase [Pseudoalteromonas sp. MMG012]
MTFIIKQGTLCDLLHIENDIPEFTSPKSVDDIRTKIDAHKHVLFVAYIEGKPVAYKLGYEKQSRLFYSWLGAVLPDYRGLGIAKSLLLHQEAYAKREGYQVIEVKSMNRFKRMLQMLIAYDYHIVGCTRLDDNSDSKITFRKKI